MVVTIGVVVTIGMVVTIGVVVTIGGSHYRGVIVLQLSLPCDRRVQPYYPYRTGGGARVVGGWVGGLVGGWVGGRGGPKPKNRFP